MAKDKDQKDTTGTENNRRSVQDLISTFNNPKAGEPLLPGIKSKKKVEVEQRTTDINIQNSSKAASIVVAQQNNDAGETENISTSVKELVSRIEAKKSNNIKIGKQSASLNEKKQNDTEDASQDQNIRQLHESMTDDNTQQHQNNNDDDKPPTTLTIESYKEHDKKKKSSENIQQSENLRKLRKARRKPALGVNNKENKEPTNQKKNIQENVSNLQKRTPSAEITLADEKRDKYNDNHPLTDIFLLENKDPEIIHIRKLFIDLCEKFNLKYEQKTNSIFIVDKKKKSYISKPALDLLINNKLENDIILHGTKLPEGTRLLKVFVIEIEAFANKPTSFIKNDRKDERIEEIKHIARELYKLHPAENESETNSGHESTTTAKSSNQRSPKSKGQQ